MGIKLSITIFYFLDIRVQLSYQNAFSAINQNSRKLCPAIQVKYQDLGGFRLSFSVANFRYQHI